MAQLQPLPARGRVAPRACWLLEAADDPELASSFFRKGEVQQSLLLLAGLLLFYVSGPFYYLKDTTVFATLITAGTLLFFGGLFYDVRLVMDQKTAAEKARLYSGAVADVLERNIPWRWTAAVMNLLGCMFSLAGCALYFPVASLPTAKSRRLEEWNANALFGLGTLLFALAYAINGSDVESIRHTLARMHGQAIPFWDDTAKVMWAFGTSLALFGCGNLLILAPDPAFFIAGGLCFALGAVICTGSTIWALHLQWQEHARPTREGLGGLLLGGGGADAGDAEQAPLLKQRSRTVGLDTGTSYVDAWVAEQSGTSRAGAPSPPDGGPRGWACCIPIGRGGGGGRRGGSHVQ